MRSLERAIAFCQSTLSYGRAQEAAPDRRMMLVEPVVAEVRESQGSPSTHRSPGSARSSAGFRSTPIRTSSSACCSTSCATPRRRWKAGRGATALRCRSASPAAAKARSPSSRSPTPARASRQDPRASVRGIPDLRPPRRQRARPRHRGRTDPRPWRRDPSGRRHHRRHLPDRHPRPPGGTPERPQRAGARVSHWVSTSFRGDAQHRTRNSGYGEIFRVRADARPGMTGQIEP